MAEAKPIGSVEKATTMNNTDYVPFMDKDGKLYQILRSDLVSVMADVMRTASDSKNGLLSSGLYSAIKTHATKVGDKNGVQICQANGRPSLVIAFDISMFSRFIIYTYWANATNTVHQINVLFKALGAEVGSSNHYGTVMIEGIVDKYTIQHALWF